MSPAEMEFFALPNELSNWISEILTDSGYWVLMWRVPDNDYLTLEQAKEEAKLNLYLDETNENNVQFFIGNKLLRKSPVFINRNDGGPRIEFLNSLCVQIIPSFIKERVLLEGAIKSLLPQEYADIPKHREFISWRNRLWRDFKLRVCDTTTEVVQLLSNGKEKRLKGIVISAGAVEWHRDGGKLKQFFDGPVESSPKGRLERGTIYPSPT